MSCTNPYVDLTYVDLVFIDGCRECRMQCERCRARGTQGVGVQGTMGAGGLAVEMEGHLGSQSD